MNEMLKYITEDQIIAQVKEIITTSGLRIQRLNTGCFAIGRGSNRRFVRTAEKGTLDFEGYDNHGRHVGIECKRPVGGKLSPEQRLRIADINGKGGIAFVATSGAEALRQLRENKCF
jgi:hypothetical protein